MMFRFDADGALDTTFHPDRIKFWDVDDVPGWSSVAISAEGAHLADPRTGLLRLNG